MVTPAKYRFVALSTSGGKFIIISAAVFSDIHYYRCRMVDNRQHRTPTRRYRTMCHAVDVDDAFTVINVDGI